MFVFLLYLWLFLLIYLFPLILTQGYLYNWFLERVKGREGGQEGREGDWLVVSQRCPDQVEIHPATRVLAFDGELNPRTFDEWADTLTTELTSQGNLWLCLETYSLHLRFNNYIVECFLLINTHRCSWKEYVIIIL